MINRKASAVWQGDLKGGTGRLSTESGALADASYAFGTRFENDKGTNPEELIGAAHAGCFSMALSGGLAKGGHAPEEIRTAATVSMTKGDAGFSITAVHLDVRGRVPGIDQAAFEQAANAAKDGCPVSRALSVEITVTATLES